MRDDTSLDTGRQLPFPAGRYTSWWWSPRSAAGGAMSGRVPVRTVVVHLLALLTIGGDAAAQRRNPSLDFRIPYAHTCCPSGLWTDGTTMLVADSGVLVAIDLATGKRDPAKEALISTPRGIWSDGDTLWVSRFGGIAAYNMSTWARDPTRDITGDDMSAGWIWSDGTTMWLATRMRQQGNVLFEVLHAYDLDSGARRSARDITLLPHHGTDEVAGLWSDGTTIWALYEGLHGGRKDPRTDARAQAYNLATGAREAGRDWRWHVGDVYSVQGLASDGITFWVGSHVAGGVVAFSVATQVREPSKDFLYSPSFVAKADVIWSDGATMWVSDNSAVPGGVAFDMSTRTVLDLSTQTDDPQVQGAADVWFDGTTMLLAHGLFFACGSPSRSPVWFYDLTARAVDLTRPFEPLLTADGSCSAGSDIASDGTTVWVSSYFENKLAAYDMGSRTRDPSRDLDNLLTTFPQALWSDGVTLWATGAGDDDVADDLYAYDLATRTRQPAKDFVDLRYHSKGTGRDEPLVPVSLWSDGATMWMANGVPFRLVGADIFAYDMATRTPDPARTIGGHELDPRPRPGGNGMASDGTTLWVAANRNLFVYDLATRSRDHLKDVILVGRTPDLDVVDSLATVDIWTDGTTMWVLERKLFESGMRLHPFEAATGRSLGPWPDLELGFREHYTGMWSDGTTMWLSVEDRSAGTPNDDLHAFNLAARSRDPGRDIVLRRGELGLRTGSMWSDGITIWVEEECCVRAYNWETGARDPRKDVLHPGAPDLPVSGRTARPCGSRDESESSRRWI